MGSKSRDASTTETNNIAMDASLTNGAGLQILDSIVVDPSDKLMVETIQQHRAAFEVMMGQGTIQLEELLGLGKDILRLADTQQVNLTGFAYQQLATGLEYLETAKQNGKYVIDFADRQAERAFTLAGDVTGGNEALARRALDVAADVKTGDQLEMVQTVAAMVLLFGLGGLYLLTREI